LQVARGRLPSRYPQLYPQVFVDIANSTTEHREIATSVALRKFGAAQEFDLKSRGKEPNKS
jgi:hypothetical protein